jgi:hypothetical protein
VYRSVGIRVGGNWGSGQPSKEPFSGRGIGRWERSGCNKYCKFSEFADDVELFGFAATD